MHEESRAQIKKNVALTSHACEMIIHDAFSYSDRDQSLVSSGLSLAGFSRICSESPWCTTSTVGRNIEKGKSDIYQLAHQNMMNVSF